MFRVHLATAKGLYRAQFAHLRGRLRLDVSSRRLPANPTSPIDLRSAQEAIGERVIRLINGCAVEAVLMEEANIDHLSKFANDAVPPPPDSDRNLTLMPDSEHFEPFVVHRLDKDFGLDPFNDVYGQAIRYLARDFHYWAGLVLEASDDYGITLNSDNTVSKKCYVVYHEIGGQEGDAEDFHIPPLRGKRRSKSDGRKQDYGEGLAST